MRPTWAEVSLSALQRNFRVIEKHVGPDVTVCAVVKADAYGHGAVECARALIEAGAAWLGVTSTEEGVRLREAGIGGRILLMTGFWRGEEEAVIRHKLTPAVWQRESLDQLQAAAKKMNVGAVPVHVKLDTGMARLGLAQGDEKKFLKALLASGRVVAEGVFSHLASAEVLNAKDAADQERRFAQAFARFAKAGVRPRFLHLANSAAIAARRSTWHNFVRPGISLYGYQLPYVNSGKHTAVAPVLPVVPVLSWKTRIIGLRDVPKGQPVGYNGAFVTKAKTTLAVLPVGYADGLSRKLSSAGRVIVRGKYAPIAGRVSMDITLADVTGIGDAAVGDEVVILGCSGECAINADEHACLAG